jgi:hypothetical protein
LGAGACARFLAHGAPFHTKKRRQASALQTLRDKGWQSADVERDIFFVFIRFWLRLRLAPPRWVRPWLIVLNCLFQDERFGAKMKYPD